MTRFIPVFALCAATAFAQQDAGKPNPAEVEQAELSDSLSEAGSSPLEFLRAIEKHLAKYPKSARRPELERAAVRAAIEAKDEKRIVLWGERVLAREANDPQILERVTRALLAAGGGQDSATRALGYAQRLEKLVHEMGASNDPGRRNQAEWRDELDRALGRALIFQSRARFGLGETKAALELARRSWDTYPTAEAARETARAAEHNRQPEEAARWLARAFTIADPRNTEDDRTIDRAKMGELWRSAKGSAAGLGEMVLEAFDQTAELVRTRRERLRAADPNSAARSPLEFTLSSPGTEKLNLATLKGKTVVMDFWATWCGPCRAQHPLIEKVKEKFRKNRDVVFLSINTDEEREAVQPFLDDVKWQDPVWYEDGLTAMLKINSIPTTIIVDGGGQVFSRMNGFVPERFVDMLTERIRDALSN